MFIISAILTFTLFVARAFVASAYHVAYLYTPEVSFYGLDIGAYVIIIY